MLLDFHVSNYKSFAKALDFSMVPASRITGLNYSVLKYSKGAIKAKALCSSVIYGPNASGKTNVIGALDTFKSIVARGHIKNARDMNVNLAANNLELIPFFNFTEEIPTKFSISFIDNELLFEYSLSILIGTFLDANFDRKILHESLKINKKIVYDRKEKDLQLSLNDIKQWLNSEHDNVQQLAISGLDEKELFLTNGFKNLISKRLAAIICNWFAEKLITVYSSNRFELRRKVNEEKRNSIEVDRALNNAAQIFGSHSNKIGFINPQDGGDAFLVSIVNNKPLPAEVFESYGTLRFMTWFPMIQNALINGATLVMDEFDASIHPMALMSIINIFHNDNINIHNAQLIFNTHNPIFLNANLLRRDEIKFVESDEETGISEIYKLSDFGTSGKTGVRKREDYLRNYFINRYGAIKNIDFTSIFEQILGVGNKENV